MMNKRNYKGYSVVCGGFLIHLALGHFYTYGNIHPYLVKYMTNYSTNKPHIDAGNSVWIFSMLAFGMGSAIAFGGFMQSKIGPKCTSIIGGCTMSISIMLSYFAVKTNVIVMAFVYGLFPGIGIGISYGVALVIPSQWFPRQKGLVIGIIMSAFGLSSLFFDCIQLGIMKVFVTMEENPNITNFNNLINKIELKNLQYSFLAVGGIYFLLTMIGSLLLTKASEIEIENHVNSGSPFENSFDIGSYQSINRQNSNEFKPHDIIMELDFWILWFTLLINAANSILIVAIFKSYGIICKLTDPDLTYIGMAGSVANCVGRVLWGYFIDRYSYKRTMCSLTFLTAVFLGSFIMIFFINNSTNNKSLVIALFTIWYVVLNSLVGGNFAIFPAICFQLFGNQNLIQNYGILFSSASTGSIITSAVTTAIWPYQNAPNTHISYLIAYSVGAGLSVIASLITLVYRGRSILKQNSLSLF